MSTGSLSSRTVVLVKHAQPILDGSTPPREWTLGADGERQAREVAIRLRTFLPFATVSSPEPKAVQTARIIAAALETTFVVVDGFEELDRPALPIVSREEHQRLNASLFATRSVPVIGRESADAALQRFEAATARAFEIQPVSRPLIVISHGTVIALFVERYTGRNAFDVWKSLDCGEFISLEVRRCDSR